MDSFVVYADQWSPSAFLRYWLDRRYRPIIVPTPSRVVSVFTTEAV